MNMGYCRFENTLADLRACLEHIDDDLGPDEADARKRLIKLCCDIAVDHDYGDNER